MPPTVLSNRRKRWNGTAVTRRRDCRGKWRRRNRAGRFGNGLVPHLCRMVLNETAQREDCSVGVQSLLALWSIGSHIADSIGAHVEHVRVTRV
jgi:hypothetical protein